MPDYTIAEDVLSAHLSGEAVLLHVGTKRYFQLNATGACIWQGLERGLGRDEIVNELCARFDVERLEAEGAFACHLAELRERDLIRVAGNAP